MQSLVRVTCTLAALALVSWALVLVVSIFGVSFLDGAVHPVVAVLAVIVTALAMDLPRRWVEKRRDGEPLMMQSSSALLLELPGFAGVVTAGASVAWSQDLGVAVVASAFVSVWAVAAPLMVRARSRSSDHARR